MSVPCPPDQHLEQLLDDRLEAAEDAALTRHVESCAACQARLERLLAGSLSSLGPAQANPETADALLIRLKRKLQSLHTPPPNSLQQGAAMMTVCCPACQKKLAIKDEWAGTKVKCRGCGQVITAPTPVAAGPAGSAADRTLSSESAAAAPSNEASRHRGRPSTTTGSRPPLSCRPTSSVRRSPPS